MAGMTASSEQAPSLFAAPFWRVCAALLCVLLTTSLMNVVVFPRFDAVFTYARDASVLANATTLIAVGLVATFRPQLLRMRALTAGCLVLLAMGSALLPVGLYTGSAVALTAAACALSIGRGWAIVMVGAAASRLGVRQAGACIALAFVAEYAVTALVWVIPAGAGTVLVWRQALPVLQATESGEAPADFSVTQPSTFLPLASQLFVCLFLFRVAFGYPTSWASCPWPRWRCTCCSRGGRFRPICWRRFRCCWWSAGGAYAAVGSVTLLAAGNALFDMVAWLVLIAVAGRNPRAAVATFAWGRGVSGLGSTAGAALGVWSNDLFGAGSPAVDFVTGALILVFVGYALIGLKHFSFAETIAGVTPVDQAVAKSPEQEFAERCRTLAERYGLSPRELEVFMMLARGRDRAYIQEQLVVSRNTVKAHVKHVYAKLDIHTHQDLIDLVEEERVESGCASGASERSAI